MSAPRALWSSPNTSLRFGAPRSGRPETGEKTAPATSAAPSPDRRTIPMALGTSGVAMAAMTSDMIVAPLRVVWE